jgi:hypothetical protein
LGRLRTAALGTEKITQITYSRNWADYIHKIYVKGKLGKLNRAILDPDKIGQITYNSISY